MLQLPARLAADLQDAPDPAVDQTLAGLAADLRLDTTPPILAGGQRQGDVYVQSDPGMRLTRWGRFWKGVDLPDGGVETLVSEGNGHHMRAIVPAGGRVTIVRRQPGWTPNIILAVEITGPAHCLIEQPGGPNPHRPLGIAPGRYVVCRQLIRHVYAAEIPVPDQPQRSVQVAWAERLTRVVD